MANNRLCGAAFVELYFFDRNESHLTNAKAVFDAELASDSTAHYWSWY